MYESGVQPQNYNLCLAQRSLIEPEGTTHCSHSTHHKYSCAAFWLMKSQGRCTSSDARLPRLHVALSVHLNPSAAEHTVPGLPACKPCVTAHAAAPGDALQILHALPLAGPLIDVLPCSVLLFVFCWCVVPAHCTLPAQLPGHRWPRQLCLGMYRSSTPQS
jgi:hypothetical protein